MPHNPEPKRESYERMRDTLNDTMRREAPDFDGEFHISEEGGRMSLDFKLHSAPTPSERVLCAIISGLASTIMDIPKKNQTISVSLRLS